MAAMKSREKRGTIAAQGCAGGHCNGQGDGEDDIGAGKGYLHAFNMHTCIH